jgi:NTE family protein
MTLAMVLGGGGSAGVAWEIGVLFGLSDAGLDVRAADTLIGTSAGAIVAANLCSGSDLSAQYSRALEPVIAAPMDLDFAAVAADWAVAARGAKSATDARRRIGQQALAADTMSPERREAEIARLLPSLEWPDRRILVTAVSAATGEFRSFDRDSGVRFLDAVGASCAVPGVWPPVLVNGEYFVDGAVRSPTNAGLALGHTQVLVIAPMLPPAPLPGSGIERELAALDNDARSEVIAADAESIGAFGSNPLDPRAGPAAAGHGYRQGLAAADRVQLLIAR